MRFNKHHLKLSVKKAMVKTLLDAHYLKIYFTVIFRTDTAHMAKIANINWLCKKHNSYTHTHLCMSLKAEQV